jgi:putative transposase
MGFMERIPSNARWAESLKLEHRFKLMVRQTESDTHMPRSPRCFEANTSYHVTLRCNKQAFDLRRPQARQAILYCSARAKAKFNFKLYGVCVMSNHVHYFLKPAQPHQMSRLMHWLNWYCAML